MSADVVVAVPLRIEACAVALGVERARRDSLFRIGMGPRRAKKAAAALRDRGVSVCVVLGFAGSLDPAVPAGTVVVATEVVDSLGTRLGCASSSGIQATLAERGIPSVSGPILSTERVIGRRGRSGLGDADTVAVDTESFWMVEGPAGSDVAVVRVVVDTPAHEIYSVPHTVRNGIKGLLTLRNLSVPLLDWAVARREAGEKAMT